MILIQQARPPSGLGLATRREKCAFVNVTFVNLYFDVSFEVAQLIRLSVVLCIAQLCIYTYTHKELNMKQTEILAHTCTDIQHVN